MKIHRFITNYKIADENIIIFDEDVVRQMSSVLKLRPGEQVVFCNGAGEDVLAEIVDIKKKEVAGKVLKVERNQSESDIKTTLYCSIIKRDNFEWVVEKTTELGVAEIVPVIAERTIKKDLNVERLRKIAKEAAELSGCGTVPVIHEPVKLAEAIKMSEGNKVNFACEKDETNGVKGYKGSKENNTPLLARRSFSEGGIRGARGVGIFVGPEGGWTDYELERFKDSKIERLGLGRTMLRAETAAIVSVFKILNQ